MCDRLLLLGLAVQIGSLIVFLIALALMRRRRREPQPGEQMDRMRRLLRGGRS